MPRSKWSDDGRWLLEGVNQSTPLAQALAGRRMDLPAEPPQKYEVYCMMCGRGLGDHGAVISSEHLPQSTGPKCQFCGGAMAARPADDRDLGWVRASQHRS